MATERVTVSIKGMTCAGCVARVEQALRQQDGVIWANINFAASQATVTYDPTAIRLTKLSKVVVELGYELQATTATAPFAENKARQLNSWAVPWQPIVAGVISGVALIGLYLGILTPAQGWQYATELLWRDRWLTGAIALSFGFQMGLYVHMRGLSADHHHGRCRAVTASGTATSSVAMIACCLHHVTDILPILGLSAVSALLNHYRIPLALVGLGINVAGTELLLHLILRTRSIEPGKRHQVTSEAAS